jgi:hypothetical protein
MEKELGMVVVADMFSYVVPEMYIDTSTPETILHDLARKQLKMPMGRHFSGAVEYLVDDFLRLAADYNADCAVFCGTQRVCTAGACRFAERCFQGGGYPPDDHQGNII